MKLFVQCTVGRTIIMSCFCGMNSENEMFLSLSVSRFRRYLPKSTGCAKWKKAVNTNSTLLLSPAVPFFALRWINLSKLLPTRVQLRETAFSISWIYCVKRNIETQTIYTCLSARETPKKKKIKRLVEYFWN